MAERYLWWLRVAFMALSVVIALSGLFSLNAPHTFTGLDLAVIWLAIGAAFYSIHQQAEVGKAGGRRR
ncbi:MAG: hypothetical protein QXG98_05940 [Candidatus Micrarchaeia archaeon]